MANSRDRKIWIEILNLYHKEFPHLWDKSHSMYSNRIVRNDAYKVLTQIYRENFDAEATVGKLKKKLENMRTTYFRELKKVKKSMESGDDEIYEPSLWYFKELNFLADIYECRDDSNSTDMTRSTAADPLKTEDTFDITSNSDQEYEPSTSQEDIKRTECRKIPKLFTKQLQDRPADHKPQKRNSEDWEVMGRSIGIQLRDISGKQLTIASKLISDTIYYAKLNKLSEESLIKINLKSSTSTLCAMCGAHLCEEQC